MHLAVEVARHAGHADVVREPIDGSVRMTAATPNLPERSPEQWAARREKIEAAARSWSGAAPGDG